MNPLMLFSPQLNPTFPRRAFTGLPARVQPRSLAGSLLLALALATAALAPAAQAQDEPVEQKQMVNINTADAEVLSSALTGIGRSRAEAIVRYRETYGPFESIEELIEVSGVGEATLARNRELITLE